MKKKNLNIISDTDFCKDQQQYLPSLNTDEDTESRGIKRYIPPTAGMGVVEVILITVVLISLVIIFQSNIKGIVSSIFSTMQSNVGKIH